jgi:hypothetical protein
LLKAESVKQNPFSRSPHLPISVETSQQKAMCSASDNLFSAASAAPRELNYLSCPRTAPAGKAVLCTFT